MSMIDITCRSVLIAGLLTVSACTTGYHERTALGELTFVKQGGYSVTELSPNYYLVDYEASAHNPFDRNRTFVLYRCATLALEQGVAGFELDFDVRPLSPPRGMTKPLYGTRVRLVAAPTAGRDLAYDASSVEKQLRPVIEQYR